MYEDEDVPERERPTLRGRLERLEKRMGQLEADHDETREALKELGREVGI